MESRRSSMNCIDRNDCRPNLSARLQCAAGYDLGIVVKLIGPHKGNGDKDAGYSKTVHEMILSLKSVLLRSDIQSKSIPSSKAPPGSTGIDLPSSKRAMRP